jgi:hypothetical protein
MARNQLRDAMVYANLKLGRALDRFVRPRKPLRNGRSFFELAVKELTTLPKKRRR